MKQKFYFCKHGHTKTYNTTSDWELSWLEQYITPIHTLQTLYLAGKIENTLWEP